MGIAVLSVTVLDHATFGALWAAFYLIMRGGIAVWEDRSG